MDSNKLIIVEDDGTQKEMEILFTFESEENGKSYVLFTDPNDETGEVFSCSYDDDGHLHPVEDAEEYAIIEEVFNTFVGEMEDEEEA
ncbi:MAG: DUF1292 domain-containing protein [Erysipelotrichaceae bacterium]